MPTRPNRPRPSIAVPIAVLGASIAMVTLAATRSDPPTSVSLPTPTSLPGRSTATPHAHDPSPAPSGTSRDEAPQKPSRLPPVEGFTLVFHDTFDEDVPLGAFPDAVADRWGAYPSTWSDTSGRGRYTPDIVSIHDSVMDIHLRVVDGVALVAAPTPLLPFGDGHHQLYGRYEVRFRADPVPGFKTAWLLWPATGVWPRDGEIDFPEGDLDGRISGYVHHQGAASGSDQMIHPTEASFDRWHTAVIEWAPGVCEFFLDGVSIGRTTTRVPDTPMRWVLQTETSLHGPGPAGDAEGHVLIDYVAVWSLDA